MSRKIRIKVVDKETRFNFTLPLGFVSRFVRFGGDVANLVAKKNHALKEHFQVDDYKVFADFIEALRNYEPFTLVEVQDGPTYVLIRTE